MEIIICKIITTSVNLPSILICSCELHRSRDRLAWRILERIYQKSENLISFDCHVCKIFNFYCLIKIKSPTFVLSALKPKLAIVTVNDKEIFGKNNHHSNILLNLMSAAHSHSPIRSNTINIVVGVYWTEVFYFTWA